MAKYSLWRRMTDNVWTNKALVVWTAGWVVVSVYMWEYHVRQFVL